MSTFGVELAVVSNRVVEINGVPVVRLELAIRNPVGVSDKLFLTRRSIDGDEFVTVASVADLTNLPEVAPTGANAHPYYRRASLTFVTDFPHEVDAFMTTIRRRLKSLVDSLKEMENNASEEVFLIEA